MAGITIHFVPHNIMAGRSYASAWAELRHWLSSAAHVGIEEGGRDSGRMGSRKGVGQKGVICLEAWKSYVQYIGRSVQTLSEKEQCRCNIEIAGRGTYSWEKTYQELGMVDAWGEGRGRRSD